MASFLCLDFGAWCQVMKSLGMKSLLDRHEDRGLSNHSRRFKKNLHFCLTLQSQQNPNSLKKGRKEEFKKKEAVEEPNVAEVQHSKLGSSDD